MKKIKKIILVLSLVIMGSLGMNAGAITCPADSIRSGESVNSLAECNVSKSSRSGESETMRLVNTILDKLIPAAAVVAVGVIIAAGYMIATSAGDAGKVKRGKATMMWGIIGLVVALMAWAIVSLVLDNVF